MEFQLVTQAFTRKVKELNKEMKRKEDSQSCIQSSGAVSTRSDPPITVGGATKCVSLTQPPAGTNDLNMSKDQDNNRRIKRPMNAYIIWSRTHRRILSRANPSASTSEISEMLGIEWRKLTEEQKMPYYAESWRLQWEHKQQFPDWEYKPRPKKRKQVCPEEAAPESTARLNIPVFSDRDSTPHHHKRKQVGLEVTPAETSSNASTATAQALLQRSSSLQNTASQKIPDPQPTPPPVSDDLLTGITEPSITQTSILDHQGTSTLTDLHNDLFLNPYNFSILEHNLFGKDAVVDTYSKDTYSSTAFKTVLDTQALENSKGNLQNTALQKRSDREPTPPPFPAARLFAMPEPSVTQTRTLDHQETSIGIGLYDDLFLDHDDLAALFSKETMAGTNSKDTHSSTGLKSPPVLNTQALEHLLNILPH